MASAQPTPAATAGASRRSTRTPWIRPWGLRLPHTAETARLAQPGSGYKNDFESETFLLQPTHSLRGEGFDASEDGTGRGTPLVPVHREIAPTVTSNYGKQPDSSDTSSGPMPVPIAFDTTQITSAANGSKPQPGGPCPPLAAGAHPPAVAFN